MSLSLTGQLGTPDSQAGRLAPGLWGAAVAGAALVSPIALRGARSPRAALRGHLQDDPLLGAAAPRAALAGARPSIALRGGRA